MAPAIKDTGLLKYLIVPDTHAPYHDRKAWALMIKAGQVFKPDVIIHLGDLADFYCVSDFNKNPNRTRLLEDEIRSVNACISDLDSLKAKEKVFLAGNHEDRLERYLMTRAPELFNMVKIPDLLKLKERNWKYIPYKKHYKVAHMYFTHDTGRAGRYAVYQSSADVGTNTVIGHTHRLSYFIEGNAEGKAHVGASFGWLGDSEEVDYMHRVRALRDWALGFGVGYLDTKTGLMHLQPVPIVQYQCVIDGKLIKV
jgi:predicted phosphodiesterase